MRPSKLDPYTAQIAEALAAGQTQAKIARGLGVHVSTLKSFVDSRLGRPIPPPAPTSPETFAKLEAMTNRVTEEEILRAQYNELKASVSKSRKAEVQDERIVTAIEDALRAHAPLQRRHVEPKPIALDAHHRQAVLISDWHGGEVVDPAQVGGLNEFNWEILERRVDGVRDALLSFKEVRPELTGLDLWVLGDMVSGDIHEELSVTNEFPVAEQSVRVGHLLGRLVAELAPHYPELYVCCVSGNHARTKKPHASKNVFDSWDWAAYQLAEATTRQLPNVQWEIPRAGVAVRKIAGLNFLLWHGDGVRSSMPGVPAGGVTRRTNEFRKQFAAKGDLLDGFACGHFHSANMWAGNVFINGSLIGTNEFGLKNFGGGEAPTQLLLTFDERKGRTTDVSFITPR